MELIKNYKSQKDEVFAIFINRDLELPQGDFEGLYFKIVPALNKANQWNCIIKLSGSLQAVWGIGRNDNSEAFYEVIRELGTLKIMQAIEKVEPFIEFMFTTYTSEKSWQEEKNKLLVELEKLQKKEPLTRNSEKKSLSEIFSQNKELRWKVLKIYYELSQGNSWNFVMRQDVANKLNIDSNGDTLFGVLKYLEDKGFLKPETNVENSITSEGLEEVEKDFPNLLFSLGSSSFQEPPLTITVDEIDSFNQVKNVSLEEVKALVPLNYSEEQIQNWFEIIIGEPIHKKDWGGETNDLFSSRLLINGKRKNSAFLLKGPGIGVKTLEISYCGKNGDQIQRLFNAPAELFIIQFIGSISEAVIEEAKSKTLLLRHGGINAQVCIIDGYDTARILKAYGKIT